MNKYEKVIVMFLEGNQEQAKAAFHEIVVEQSRAIYEGLMDDEDFDVDVNADDIDFEMDDVEDLANDVESDEQGLSESFRKLSVKEAKAVLDLIDGTLKESSVGIIKQLAESMGMDEEEFKDAAIDNAVDVIDAAYPDAEDDGDMGEEMDFDNSGDLDDHEEEHEDIEDRVVDLEDAIDELKAEFDQLLAAEEGEDHDFGDEESSDEGEEEMEDEFGAEDEMEAGEEDEDEDEDEDEELVREYIEKLAGISNKEDAGTGTKSPVAGKNDMGGTADNIASGEGNEKGRKAPSAKEAGKDYQNKPTSKAGKTAFKKKEKAKVTKEKGGKADSLLGK